MVVVFFSSRYTKTPNGRVYVRAFYRRGRIRVRKSVDKIPRAVSVYTTVLGRAGRPATGLNYDYDGRLREHSSKTENDRQSFDRKLTLWTQKKIKRACCCTREHTHNVNNQTHVLIFSSRKSVDLKSSNSKTIIKYYLPVIFHNNLRCSHNIGYKS